MSKTIDSIIDVVKEVEKGKSISFNEIAEKIHVHPGHVNRSLNKKILPKAEGILERAKNGRIVLVKVIGDVSGLDAIASELSIRKAKEKKEPKKKEKAKSKAVAKAVKKSIDDVEEKKDKNAVPASDSEAIDDFLDEGSEDESNENELSKKWNEFVNEVEAAS